MTQSWQPLLVFTGKFCMFHVIGRKQYNGYQLRAAFYFSRLGARAVAGPRRSLEEGEVSEGTGVL